MAKTKISEYDANPTNNTDIDGINLAEGMAPGLVNNAIRELMSQLKALQAGTAGDDFTVGGDLDVTGTTTLTGNASAVNLNVTGNFTIGGQAIESFASGTRMLFQQTNAPTGWTKQTSNDEHALRVVSGTAGTGGSVDFTTAFASQNVGGTSLTEAQLPSHTHSFSGSGTTGGGGSHNHTGTTNTAGSHAHSYTYQVERNGDYFGSAGESEHTNTSGTTSSAGSHSHSFTTSTVGNHSHSFSVSGTTGGTGSGSTHTHSLNIAVKYVDVIICEKD